MMMRVHAIKQDFNDKALTIPTAIIVKNDLGDLAS